MDFRIEGLSRPNISGSKVKLLEDNFSGLNSSVDHILEILNLSSGRAAIAERVNLLDLAPFLSKICLVDFILEGDGKILDAIGRFEGADVSSVYGELTGISLKQLPSSEVIERVFRAFDRILELKKPVFSVGSADLEGGLHIRVDTLYLPLATEGGTIRGALLYVDFIISQGS